jgi:hypothetical protein
MILFIGLVILTYPVAIIIYGELVPDYFQKNIFYEKFAYGFSYTRYKEVKKVKDIDILFLGSSRAYRHYDPRHFEKAGYSSFNLGSSSQTFLQTEILVNRYLNSLNPRYVILDIYPGMFASDGIESSTDLISNDFNDWDTFKMALELKNMMIINTWIYSVYQEKVKNSLKDSEPAVKGENKYIQGGYVEREISANNKNVNTLESWNFNENQWQAFKGIVQSIKDSKKKLIIIHSPRNKGYKYQNQEKLLKYLKTQEIDYYNYHRLKFINDSLHFYDSSHMNQNGTNLYNDFLIEVHLRN